jgi:hypothetical protein
MLKGVPGVKAPARVGMERTPSQLPARVELDDTISDVEDINLICSLILLERKLANSRLSVKDLKDNFSLHIYLIIERWN